MARSKLKMAPKAKQGIAPKGKAGALRRPELARECQFLITNSDKPGQHLGYSIFFDGEKFTGKDAPGYEPGALVYRSSGQLRRHDGASHDDRGRCHGEGGTGCF
jgi:hypothetical protein